VSMRLVADSDVKGFKEILPVKRYDAQKAAVKVPCLFVGGDPRF